MVTHEIPEEVLQRWEKAIDVPIFEYERFIVRLMAAYREARDELAEARKDKEALREVIFRASGHLSRSGLPAESAMLELLDDLDKLEAVKVPGLPEGMRIAKLFQPYETVRLDGEKLTIYPAKLELINPKEQPK